MENENVTADSNDYNKDEKRLLQRIWIVPFDLKAYCVFCFGGCCSDGEQRWRCSSGSGHGLHMGFTTPRLVKWNWAGLLFDHQPDQELCKVSTCFLYGILVKLYETLLGAFNGIQRSAEMSDSCTARGIVLGNGGKWSDKKA